MISLSHPQEFKWYLTKFFSHVQVPYPLHYIIYLIYLTLINIDHSKKSTKISHTANFFAKCSFFFTNLSQGNFLYCPQGFWYYIKFLLQPALLLKWNKTCCIEFSLVKIFVSFVELLKLNLNIGLNKYGLFLTHVK